MAFDEEFKDRVMDVLIPFGDVTGRKMFGGYGIFEAGAMFALISSDELYFKVDDSNRARYEAMGSAKFGNMPYYRLPPDVPSTISRSYTGSSKCPSPSPRRRRRRESDGDLAVQPGERLSRRPPPVSVTPFAATSLSGRAIAQ